VLHKWLYDRKGRVLTAEDIMHYQRVVAALSLTRSLMDEIDALIAEHGGFPLAGSIDVPHDPDNDPQDIAINDISSNNNIDKDETMPDEIELDAEDEAILDVVWDEIGKRKAAERAARDAERLPINDDKDHDESEDITMSKNDWQEQQPKLIYVAGDQLPLSAANHSDQEDEDGQPIGPDSAVEIDSAGPLSADTALTRAEGIEVEIEVDDPEATPRLLKPFDPSKIRMNSQQMSLDPLIKRMQDERMSIPNYQRSAGIWTDTKKSRLGSVKE